MYLFLLLNGEDQIETNNKSERVCAHLPLIIDYERDIEEIMEENDETYSCSFS